MRLGERLIREEIVTLEQVNEALRTQVLRGGRIGTNLVELGYVNIEVLSGCLGRHYGMPVATEKHFEMASPDVQTRLPVELAGEWGIVPIGRVPGGFDQIGVAVMNPLPESVIQQISEALGSQLILAVAPELRVLYQLEQVYGIPRSNRYIRVPTEDMLPSLGAPTDDEPEIEIDMHIDEPADAPGEAGARRPAPPPVTAIKPAPPPRQTPAAPTPVADEDEPTSPVSVPELPSRKPAGSERRAFVKTLSEGPPDSEQQLARIPIKRVNPDGQPVSAPAPATAPSSLEGAFRSIRQATGRDRVGDLVVFAMRDFFDAVFDAGTILVVRKPIAIGWKGFVRSGASEVIEAIALPLNGPSSLHGAFHNRAPYVGPPPHGGSELDRRLWALLKTDPPGTVASAPIALNEQVVCLLYAQSALPPDQAMSAIGDNFATLADCTARAFLRLIRAAQR